MFPSHVHLQLRRNSILPAHAPKACGNSRATLMINSNNTRTMKRAFDPANWKSVLSICVAMVGLVATAYAAAPVQITRLRCEYNQNPMAVDSPKPRLSWIIEAPSNQRGVRQTAWQVLVASSEDILKQNKGDLWDSGKTHGDDSVNIEYAGKPVPSAQTVFWKVRVWDQNDQPSNWSAPARWTAGPLKASDWKAQWIGHDSEPAADPVKAKIKELLDLKNAKWVWTHGAKPGNQPAGDAYFRKAFDVRRDSKIKQAVFNLAADDAFVLYANGKEAGQASTWRTLSTIDLTGQLVPGQNTLAIKVTNGGSNPSPAGLLGKLAIIYEDGQSQVVPIDASWASNISAPDGWNSTGFSASGWQPASEVAAFGDQPWGQIAASEPKVSPASYLRKAFTIEKPVKRAVVFASALGVYELHINGQTADRDVLSPGWTDYRKRVHYFGYDVTSKIRRGENVLGAILGDGWYAGYLAFTGKRNYYGEKTRFIAQLHIEYQDGSAEIVGTDSSWKASYGPIREGDLLMGCVYDARLEMPGWNNAGFNDANWANATVDQSVRANLEAHPGQPIRRIQEIKPRKITEPKPGVYVFDLGQNMVGWVRLKAKGQPGQKVVVRHAEMLNPDGTIYTTNLRAAKATDTYYLAGGPKRDYEPYFTFHGFQYVEVTGLDYKPDLGDVAGIVVHSDLPRVSSFECSEPLVNKLVLNTVWGQKGNFLDVPTDCPQRDERAGWTGDAQVFMKTACLNLDAPAFFTKWLVDLCQDSQRADGAFGDVAPHINIVSHGNTGWSDAGPVCNWQMWRMYGDTHVLQKHYQALLRHADFLAKTSTNFVRGTGAYGDWLRLAGPQHSEVIGTAYYYYSTRLLAEIAAAIGNGEDSKRFQQLAANIKSTFAEKFIKDDGRILDAKNETGQTFYALAFGLDLVPSTMKDKVAQQFVKTVEAQDWHLATGFLGTPFVLFALEKAGHADLAYRMVLNKTYPSWLQQVIWGSTTMWERWDGWRPDKGFQDPGMNSFNHYWLGCVGEWLYTKAAGIDTDAPGFKTIQIRPVLDPAKKGFSWVRAHYDSIRGRIESNWRLKGDTFELQIRIPANTSATVYLPAKDFDSVMEGGKPVKQSDYVKYLRNENGTVVLSVGSGQYRFTSRL